MVRDDARITCFFDEEKVFDVTIDDEDILRNLNDNPRFKFYGWQGGKYEISNAVLTDGKE